MILRSGVGVQDLQEVSILHEHAGLINCMGSIRPIRSGVAVTSAQTNKQAHPLESAILPSGYVT